MPADPEHVAALRAAGLDPARAERIGEGWFAVAYRDGARVARVLKPAAAEAGWAERYVHEVALLRSLAARGLPVPREARAIRDAGGRLLATTHRYVDGHATTELRLRPRARARLAAELAGFLSALHAMPVAEATAIGLPSLDLASELYEPLVEEASPLVGLRSRAWLHARLEAFTAGGGSAGTPRVVVHGDLGPPHILIGEDGSLRGVIDFGDALVADPAFDFAALAHDYSWRFAERVLAGYEGAAARDADLRRRADFYVDVAPLYATVYGRRLGDARLFARGRRQIAARAAAATRAAAGGA